MIDPALYDQARDRIAASGFTPEIQTKITLFLCTAKNGNLMFHSSVQWMQNLNVVQQFILSQYSRELEAVTLLSRTTQWATNPALAVEASRIAAPLMLAWGQIMLPPGPLLTSPAPSTRSSGSRTPANSATRRGRQSRGRAGTS